MIRLDMSFRMLLGLAYLKPLLLEAVMGELRGVPNLVNHSPQLRNRNVFERLAVTGRTYAVLPKFVAPRFLVMEMGGERRPSSRAVATDGGVLLPRGGRCGWTSFCRPEAGEFCDGIGGRRHAHVNQVPHHHIVQFGLVPRSHLVQLQWSRQSVKPLVARNVVCWRIEGGK